ncbi:uncharacterized protein FOMMEDRAFT_80258, partial [Fomitiporia mediterranea MF3/22]|uniref:uncharacterized protein n=1 Tax=Fomitiporia mediterranea (strain MF3/22) TaxID=694068 RepID=UPI0004407912
VKTVYNNLGHKGVYSVQARLLDCFWWPSLGPDIKYYICTCHKYQLCQTTQILIPPSVLKIASLFAKVHIDTKFILKAGGVCPELVTDNRTLFVAALDWLHNQYHINHICISTYNSQANSIIEHCHFDIQEALMKAAEGNELQWYEHTHSVFWLDRITIHCTTSMSPYFIVHNIEPLLPFDITEAMYLTPAPDKLMTTTELITTQACQLQKRLANL